MSIDLTAALQRKAKVEPDSHGDVTIASVWLAFYLLMIVGAPFVNRNGSGSVLAVFAALLGGWGVFGWRRKKKAGRIIHLDDATAVCTHHFGQGAKRRGRVS